MRANWSLGKIGFVLFGALIAACAPSGGEGGVGGGKRDAQVGFEDDFELDSGSDSPFLGDAACAAVTEEANETPLSLYVMLDKSMSMETRWDRAMSGLKAFLNDSKSGGINIALGFFPRPPGAEECNSEYYLAPAVDFGLLPGHASKLVAAIDAERPDGRSTPVFPALGGAIRKAMALAQTAKDEKRAASAAVLLVTDGEPEGQCKDDHDAIAAHAKNGLAKDVRTFVVGLPGVNRDFANLIASAGGTEKAIVIESNDVEGQFQKALADVRGQALPCEYALPDQVLRGDIAIGQVNVVWTHGGSKDTETIPKTSDCSQGGWQYDDPAKPSTILLCPSTCAAIKDDLQAKIDIELGCATIVR